MATKKKTIAKATSVGPYAHLIGKPVLIRTVTMIYTGKLQAVFPQELVITDAAWIADTDRWAQAVANASFREVEPYPSGKVVVGRGAIVDACALGGKLPREQK